MKAVRARISGRVQGVWFRAWTERQAAARGLDGWVRNRRDGVVEALFAGPDDEVAAMLAECRDGPPMARVAAVETEDAEPPETPGFRTLATE